MKFPLARALLKVAAVLLVFAVLGVAGWNGLLRVTDDRLLGRLDAVPGLSQVQLAADRVSVQVASDLTPAAAQQTVTRVAQIAKNQQFYRSLPVELQLGPFSATMLAAAPGAALGQFRGDAASLLTGLGGVAAGELHPDGTVQVEVAGDQDLLEWTVIAAQMMENNGLRVRLQTSDGDAELGLDAGRDAHRHLLWASYHAITGSGGSIDSLQTRQSEAGAALLGTIGTPDREIAVTVLSRLAELVDRPDAADGLTLQIADDLLLTGLGDAAGTLALADLLNSAELRLAAASTDRSRLELTAASPQALDELLTKAAAPDWPLGGGAQIIVRPDPESSGGLVANGNNLELRVRAYQQLWSAGFPELFVGPGDAPKGAVIGFQLGTGSGHDFTAADTQLGLIGALRGLDWVGRASFSLQPDEQATALHFISTAQGEASDVVKPRALGGRWWHRPGWGQQFIDNWDASATT